MRPNSIAAVLVVSIVAAHSDAAILDFRRLQIDFTNAADAKNRATWSEPEKLTVSKDGLGWDGEATSSRDGWIQTTPLAVGYSWRAPYGVSVRVAIQPRPVEAVLNNGRKWTPYGGNVFVRYSPDLKHWSSWQVLQSAQPQSTTEKTAPGRLFDGKIQVPNIERNGYCELLREYSRLDVPWKSDEEAAVRWVLKRRPDFFSRHLPFIGYIQFRFESSFHGGQRIKSFRADVSYGMSGVHLPPEDKNAYKSRDSIPWRFVGDEATDVGQPPEGDD